MKIDVDGLKRGDNPESVSPQFELFSLLELASLFFRLFLRVLGESDKSFSLC